VKLIHLVIAFTGAAVASVAPFEHSTSGGGSPHVCPPRTTLQCGEDGNCSCFAEADTRADLVAVAAAPHYCERNVTDEAQMLFVRVRNVGLTRAPRSATAVSFGPITRKGSACGSNCYTTVIANTPPLEPHQEVAVSLPIPVELRRINALGGFGIRVDYDDTVPEPVSTNDFTGTCGEPQRLSTDD
jgi:hypothetical protein